MRPLSILLSVALASAAGLALAQDGERPEPSVGVSAVTEFERLLYDYAKLHGGLERFNSIENISFDLVPTRYELDETTGETRPVEDAPMRVEAFIGENERGVRTEEEIEGNRIVRISDGLNASVWVDDQPTQLRELRETAMVEARGILCYLDLLYKPERPDLRQRVEGVMTRGGQEYVAVAYEFHESRQLYLYRVFYNSKTGFPERIDQHEHATKRRLGSLLLSDYASIDGIQVPTRFLFRVRLDRGEDRPTHEWRLVNTAIDALSSDRLQSL